ncbi:hypothetical protein YC2023_039409 [Brassica napus]
MEIFNHSEEIPTDIFCRTPHFIRSNQIFFPISLFLSAELSLLSRDFRPFLPSLSTISGESALILLNFSHCIMSNDDQTRPRHRRGHGGTGSQSRDSSQIQDSASPHSSYHTSPSPFPAPAPPAPAAAPAPAPPGPPGVMSVEELVRQPGRNHLPYLTPYPYGRAEENDGEPVDDLALMKRAYTNKKTGQIDDGLVREVVTLVQTQVQDEVSQLQTEDNDSTASTNLSRVRINEIVESSVPKKKGCLIGFGRRSRSVPPFSAPPPFVDPEVLTAQLMDKDDRISLLETQMAAQQAGYEAQKRLNQQMMEMMKRMYPNEVFPNVQDPWGKNPHESDFLRKISRENWIWLDNVWLVNKDRFFSKVRNVSSNIQYDSTRSSFVQVTDSSQLNGSSDQFIDPFDSISNEDSEYHYHTLINQREMNFRGLDHRKVHRNIPRKFSLGIFRGPFRRTGGPRSFLENSFPRNSVGNFRGISEEK